MSRNLKIKCDDTHSLFVYKRPEFDWNQEFFDHESLQFPVTYNVNDESNHIIINVGDFVRMDFSSLLTYSKPKLGVTGVYIGLTDGITRPEIMGPCINIHTGEDKLIFNMNRLIHVEVLSKVG